MDKIIYDQIKNTIDRLQPFYDQIKGFIFGILMFLQIEKQTAFILIVLICANMVTGGFKAIMLKDLKFSYKSLYAGVVRKSLILIVVMLLALIGKGVGIKEFRLLVEVVMKIMILTEGSSAINNIRSVFDKKEYKSTDFLSVLLSKISEYLKMCMEKAIKIFDNNADCGNNFKNLK